MIFGDFDNFIMSFAHFWGIHIMSADNYGEAY